MVPAQPRATAPVQYSRVLFSQIPIRTFCTQCYAYVEKCFTLVWNTSVMPILRWSILPNHPCQLSSASTPHPTQSDSTTHQRCHHQLRIYDCDSQCRLLHLRPPLEHPNPQLLERFCHASESLFIQDRILRVEKSNKLCRKWSKLCRK